MNIEIAVVISAIALAFSVVQVVTNIRRGNRNDAKTESAQLTTVIVKLENIGNDVSEIKGDLRDVKEDLKDHSERLVRVEQEIKVLNKTVFGKGDNK